MNPIRNSLEPKKTLRFLRDVYVSLRHKEGNKNGNSGRKERMVVWFHSMNPESPLGYKKEGLFRGEARVPGSSIRENVWTRLKFFRQIAVPVQVHFRASFEAGPKGRKFPFR